MCHEKCSLYPVKLPCEVAGVLVYTSGSKCCGLVGHHSGSDEWQ